MDLRGLQRRWKAWGAVCALSLLLGACGGSSQPPDETGFRITIESLDAAVQDQPYSTVLTTAGGTGGITWTVTTGFLPNGITLSSTGTLSGTPTVAGIFNITVQATDSAATPQTATQVLVLQVAVPMTISTSTLQAGTITLPYSQILGATGGIPPYKWSLTAGALPDGLMLEESGLVSGTPTVTGTFVFTVKVSDSATPAQELTGDVTLVIGQLEITTPGLPSTTVNTPYLIALASTGGTGLFNWTITIGSLPDGLTLAETTGLISGTPTAVGTSTFTVHLLSGQQTAEKQFTIRVGEPINPSVELISLASDGTPGNGGSGDPALSPDGRFVAFSSFSTNLVPMDTNAVPDVFVRDLTCGVTERVSVASDLTEGNLASFGARLSALRATAGGNFLFVTYSSDASTLLGVDINGDPIDGNDTRDVFVTAVRAEDAPTCTLTPVATIRVSEATDGTEGNNISTNPDISADGRFIVFQSSATNLTQRDRNSLADVFLSEVDFTGGQLTLLSTLLASRLDRFNQQAVDIFSDTTIGNSNLVLTDGALIGALVEITSGTGIGQARIVVANDSTTLTIDEPWGVVPDATSLFRVSSPNNGASGFPGISADGSIVVFGASGSFGPEDNVTFLELVLQDRATGTISRESLGFDGSPPTGSSTPSMLNDNGSLLLFTATATNLVADDTNLLKDLFLLDRTTATNTRLNLADDGSEANGPIGASGPTGVFESSAMSNSALLVVYESSATNLSSPDFNQVRDVFLLDRTGAAPVTTKLSRGLDDVDAAGPSFDVTISLDGSTIIFASDAPNLVPGDANQSTDLFLVRTSVMENPVFLKTELQTAAVGTFYDRQMLALGGEGGVRFIPDGPLPPGLQLDPDSGRLFGFPSTEGEYSFGILVMDAGRPARMVRRSFVFRVHPD